MARLLAILLALLITAPVFGKQLCDLSEYSVLEAKSPGDFLVFVQDQYPDSQAIFLATNSQWLITALGILVPLIGLIFLFLAYFQRGDLYRSKPLILVAVTAVFGIGASMVPTEVLLSKFSLPLEGNSGRNITQIFSLFHQETFRPAIYRLILALGGEAALPPVFVYAKTTVVFMAMAIPVFVAAGIALGAGVFLSLVGIGSILFSTGVSQYLVSDHAIGGITLTISLVFLALEKVWVSDGTDKRGRFGAISALILQWLVFDLRSEMLVLWFVPDVLILVAWLKGQSPRDYWGDASIRIRSNFKILVSQPLGAILVVLSTVFIVILSVILVYLPFWIFDQPKTFLYFPFMMSTVVWGGFFPGLIKTAPWLSIAAIGLMAVGMFSSFARPLLSKGVGLGFISLMSANWYRYTGHSNYEFIRLVVPMVPLGVILGIQFFASRKELKVPVATGLASLSILLTIFGFAPEGHNWIQKFTAPAIAVEDNSVEAKYLGSVLKHNPGACLVAPILADEIVGSPRVPEEKAVLDVMLFKQDLAILIPLRIDASKPQAIDELVPMLDCICDSWGLYLGLDCHLEGLDFCQNLEPRCLTIGQTSVGKEFYNNPNRFGQRREHNKSLEICRWR